MNKLSMSTSANIPLCTFTKVMLLPWGDGSAWQGLQNTCEKELLCIPEGDCTKSGA